MNQWYRWLCRGALLGMISLPVMATEQQVTDQPLSDPADFCLAAAKALSGTDPGFFQRYLLVEPLTASASDEYLPEFAELIWKGVIAERSSAKASEWRAVVPSPREQRECVLYAWTEDVGLSALRLSLRQTRQGIRFTDWFDFVLGSSIQELIRTSYTALMGRIGPLGLGAMVDPGLRQDGRAFAAFGQALQGRDFQQLQKAFRQLPVSLQQHPMYLNRYAQGLNAMDATEAWQEAMAELIARVGDDPTYSLAFLDYYILRGDVEKTSYHVGQLRESLGDVPPLDLIMVMLELKKENAPVIPPSLYGAIARHPNEENFYWLALERLLKKEQYQDATLVLDVLHGLFGYEFEKARMKKISHYEGFLKSDVFKVWYHGNRSKG